jgi:hypothetical protein
MFKIIRIRNIKLTSKKCQDITFCHNGLKIKIHRESPRKKMVLNVRQKLSFKFMRKFFGMTHFCKFQG